jgi:glycosyltransferase involved in cell wall biosynthesis
MRRIVIITHGFTDDIYRVGSLHYAKEFAKDYEVLLISAPVSLINFIIYPSKNLFNKLTNSLKGIYKTCFGYSEFIPFSLLPPIIANTKIGTFFNKLGFSYIWMSKKRLRKHGFSYCDCLIIENPLSLWMTKFIDYKKLIYRATDIYTKMNKNKLIEEYEAYCLDKAYKIITTSEGIKKYFQQNYEIGKKIFVLENGVDLENFQRNNNLDEKHKYLKSINNKLVYVGAFDSRVDLNLIKYIAEKRKDWQILLIGEMNNKVKNLNIYKNIHLLGPIRYEVLPSILKICDIGLLPFDKSNIANEGRSPMKLYEYGICGLPVVAITTFDLSLKNESFVFLSDNREEFEQNIVKAIENLPSLSKEAIESSRVKSWKLKASKLMEIVDD